MRMDKSQQSARGLGSTSLRTENSQGFTSAPTFAPQADHTIQPSSLALVVASFQAFPTNAACEIGDRRSTSTGTCLL